MNNKIYVIWEGYPTLSGKFKIDVLSDNFLYTILEDDFNKSMAIIKHIADTKNAKIIVDKHGMGIAILDNLNEMYDIDTIELKTEKLKIWRNK